MYLPEVTSNFVCLDFATLELDRAALLEEAFTFIWALNDLERAT